MTTNVASAPLLSVFSWLATVAGALAFTPLLDDNGYVFSAAWLAFAPLAVGCGLRLLRAPLAVVLPGQVVALALWLTLLYFPDTATAGVFPTMATFEALGGELVDGAEVANAYAPPAPASEGLVLMTALGVTVCFLLVDALAAGLRRVPLTGLPLLALYTVPAALAPSGVPVLAFLVGGTAFLLLLGYDERDRLGHWGRQISSITGLRTQHENRRLNLGAMNASAGRVGVVALGAAAVLPMFIPVLPEGLLAGPGGGTGPGEVQVTNPIVDLRRDLVQRSNDVAMTVRTRSSDVSYFRLAALDEFDGEKWRFSDRDVDAAFDLRGPLTAPPGLDAKVDRRTEPFVVEVASGFHSEWLPAPYAPVRVRVDGEWRYDPDTLDIVAGTEETDTAGRAYAVTSVQPLPTFEQLDNAGGAPTSISGRYTDVPDEVPDQVGELAERITERGASRFQRAVLLQDWFRTGGGFRYSLQTPDGHSGDDILAFLRDRVGYCEQFAAAMALMARELDIPARVAVGFLNAEPTGQPDVYRYAFADMHAWPEMYFEGVGWVRFEPTPAARAGAASPPYTRGDATQANPFQTQDPGPTPTVQPPQGQQLGQLDPGASATGGAPDDATSPWWFVVAALAVLLLFTPAVTRVVLRRRRLMGNRGPVEQAEAVWSELRDSMRDLRYDWPVDTPRRTAARVLPLVRRRAGAESALRRLAVTVERARFARSPGDGSTLEHDLRLVVDALLARETRWDRFKATMLPRSLRAAYRRQNRQETQGVRNLALDVDASALPSAP
ncbi:MAG: DUF3488 and transglutaminase-like domain-containing protein [Actinomycetota bacterium]|nr:DUF3488 and transglutaminase-like domain-containing protein [Actinomycetota bacterium]